MSADAVCLAAHRLVGLSWGEPSTRREYSRLLAPWDPEPVAVQMAGEQSSCALAICAALLIAEVDGAVRGWRGQAAIDPLRAPRAGRYDSLPYLEQLARQRGLYTRVGEGAPDLRPGVWWLVDGARQGDEHVGLVVAGPDKNGWVTCVEGGQLDPLSPHQGAKACTRVAIRRHRPERQGGRWILSGRPLIYTADAGALATLDGQGMPWERIGVTP